MNLTLECLPGNLIEKNVSACILPQTVISQMRYDLRGIMMSQTLLHRCRSRQIFGGAKDFCPNFLKLARKKLQRKWPQKKQKNNCVSSHVGCIFLNQSTLQEPFCQNYPKLAQISPNSPEKNKITWHPNKIL